MEDNAQQNQMKDSVNVDAFDSKKTSRLSILGLCFFAAFVALCGHYIFAHWEDFSFVSNVSLPETAVAGFLILISYLVNSYQLHLFLRKFGIRLRLMELTALNMAMLLGNLVIPMRGGTGGLAVYLKRVHGLDFQAFAVIYAGTALLVALINAALSLVALFILGWFYDFIHPGLTICIVAIFACCLYLGVFLPPLKWQDSRIFGPVFRAADSWHVLTRDRRLLISATVSLLLISVVLMTAFYFIYGALGTPLSLSGVMITSSLGNIANLIPITPGSLGIFDAVVIQIPQLFGVDPARAIAATLVFRVLCFFWALLLGIPGMYYLFKNGPTGKP